MTQHKVDFRSIPWTSPVNGMREKAYKIGSRRLRLVEYSRDMLPHWCEKGHLGYLLDGMLEIKFENEVCTYSPGDGISLPSGQEHRHMARVLTDTATVIFVEDV